MINNQINFNADLLTSKRGRKPILYMVLDCETATLPFITDLNLSQDARQRVSIAKPLIYDLGWQIVDKAGNVYSRHSILITETFFVPNIFNTAYYADKRQKYLDKYNNREIITMTWQQATDILEQDLQHVHFVTAYNAMFDFKKAIPFTEEYFTMLYSPNYNVWEQSQKASCKRIANKIKSAKTETFDNMYFDFRGQSYPIADIWGLACKRLINNNQYKDLCLRQGMISESGQYFKTSAETAFRYLAADNDFREAHTAIEDAIIETDILKKILSKGRIEQGIKYFPFKTLGTTIEYLMNKKTYKPEDIIMLENAIYALWTKLNNDCKRGSGIESTIEKSLVLLADMLLELEEDSEEAEHIFKACLTNQLLKKKDKLNKKLEKAKTEGTWTKYYHQIQQIEIQLEALSL